MSAIALLCFSAICSTFARCYPAPAAPLPRLTLALPQERDANEDYDIGELLGK